MGSVLSRLAEALRANGQEVAARRLLREAAARAVNCATSSLLKGPASSSRHGWVWGIRYPHAAPRPGDVRIRALLGGFLFGYNQGRSWEPSGECRLKGSA